MNKRLNVILSSTLFALLLSACGPSIRQYDGTEVQGVSATKILIGNTAATSGNFASVGVPFNSGLNAMLDAYNAAGGFKGKTIELKHYDDGFDGAQGLTYTQRLVEEDKVFALVGHFGTNTVGSTVDYIKEQGVPMVYAATGISDLYQEEAVGFNRAVMPVQPIYNTEGRALLGRALAATTDNIGLGGTKVGVISTTDDAGEGMLAGVKRQAEELNKTARNSIKYVTTKADAGTNHSAPINTLKSAGVDVIIIAANQAPFAEIMGYLRDANVTAKIITSYVSANAATLGALVDSGAITQTRPVFTTAWLDVPNNLNDYLAYAAIQTARDTLDLDGGPWIASAYAIAGYIAAKIFIMGLERVEEANKELTWLNYIEAMEESPVDLPMGGELDFSDGARLGIAELALNTIGKNSSDAHTLLAVDGLKGLDTVWAAVPANLK